MIDLSRLQSFISNLSKRERMVLYSCLIFVSLALLDRLIISPAFTKKKLIEEKIKNKKLMIKKDLYFLSLKEKIDFEVSKYKDYFRKEKKSPDEEMNSLLKLIEDIARRTGVDLLYIKPAGFKSSKAQNEFYIDLTCQGKMPNIVRFIYRIESSPQLLNIEKFTLSAIEEGSPLAQCRMTILKISIP
jgi:hypothetical protein